MTYVGELIIWQTRNVTLESTCSELCSMRQWWAASKRSCVSSQHDKKEQVKSPLLLFLLMLVSIPGEFHVILKHNLRTFFGLWRCGNGWMGQLGICPSSEGHPTLAWKKSSRATTDQSQGFYYKWPNINGSWLMKKVNTRSNKCYYINVQCWFYNIW